MKLLFISFVLSLVFTHACLGQGKVNDRKALVEGFIELDGKPLRNATVSLASMTNHLQSGDWLIPIITPRVIAVIGETGTTAQETSDWSTHKKTDKSGRFRADVPVGMKIQVFITASSPSASAEKQHNAPCAFHLNVMAAQAGAVQNLRYNLNSGRTPAAKGGCLELLDDK